MHDDALAVDVSALLAPYADALGSDRPGYTNHVIRVLLYCDQLWERAGAAGDPPSRQVQYRVSGAFHDLGIWTDETFDYLVPSIDLAAAYLEGRDCKELIPVVTEMIDMHHKQRPAGPPDSAVEIFRRADAIDVSLGLRRFGLPISTVRATKRAYPGRGFHRTLIRLTAKRTIEHPTSPLPVFKW
ncbi:MAG: phosphohydrolase [Solirubrobacterales bacterium]